MITTVLASNQQTGYRNALAVARQTLEAMIHSCTVDEFVAEAMHAMNACRRYVKTGRLRLSHNTDLQPVIVIVTRRNVVTSPSIQKLLMWADAESVMNFLAKASGIGVIINTMENPF